MNTETNQNKYFMPTEKTDVRKLIRSLKEHTLYSVWVCCNRHNPIHKAFLFTGFKNGAYTEVYNNNYAMPISIGEIYFLEIIKELDSVDK